jgi:hypothetical protein
MASQQEKAFCALLFEVLTFETAPFFCEYPVFCTIISGLETLAFKTAGLSHFSRIFDKDRERRKEIALRIHQTIPTAALETVTCQIKSRAEGFGKENEVNFPS